MYTCDVINDYLPMDPPEPKLSKRETKLRRVKARIARDRYRTLVFDGQVQTGVKFETDKDLIEMRRHFPAVIFRKLDSYLIEIL